MKFLNYTHKEVEPLILTHWAREKIVDQLRKRNEKGPKFYFLDGPPYTSGKFHLAHAWNYALKDFILRYKRSRGFHLWDRNGFDMHGLPTEHKVMEKFKLETKEDILKFGLDKFNLECEKFSLEMAKIMGEDLFRMGVTFDLSNPYMPIKPEFIEGEWQLIKRAHEQNRLYYGQKVMTWCQHCETAVAKHECEYKNVQEDSIFVKFPIKGKKNEYLIVWTTTPWTIPFNLAVMVNPEIEYVKVEVSADQSKVKEKWILAKALAGIVVQAVANKKMKVLEEYKGKELEGLEYVHPFAKILPQYKELKKKNKNVHTVILSEQYVDTSAGSGLVHCAPGCGPEDQEACQPYQIPPFNTLNEKGYFPEEMGEFSGLRAKVNDKKFIHALKDADSLIAVTDVEHEYPHCWRCHQPIVFRLTEQWFFKVEDLKEKIVSGDKDVAWVPETAKNAYESWTKNLRDNSISRQRYWGTPLPIWKCTDKKCAKITVIGSRSEIEKNGGKVPENLHIPWIDAVELKCSCGKIMKRVPDVIDVWVDSGTTSWNCLNNNPELIKQWYPANAILEAKEQTRLWFSMLSICSYIFYGNNAFKNVYAHGMLNDIEGKKMSKSLGNIVSPYELIDKHGVDVLRYYMCQNNAGVDINFSWEECANKARYLQILWNVHKLLINLGKENKINPAHLRADIIWNVSSYEEKYIISKLNNTIKKVTHLFETYQLDKTIAPLEELYIELSRTYIQMVRDKSSLGEEQEKEVCIYTIYKVLLELLKMFSVIAPFVTEAIYLNLREEFQLPEESITHFTWPKVEEAKINLDLEQEMSIAQDVIGAVLSAREKIQWGLRWPIKEILILTNNNEAKSAVKLLSEILKKQTNVKAIKLIEKLRGLNLKLRPDCGKIGPAFGALSPQIVTKLTQDSPETILKHLDEENVYQFVLDGREIKITREMLIIERNVPEQFAEAQFKFGYVYLSKEKTPELEAEGYSREVMRNLQEMRKKAGLEKLDRVNVYLLCSSQLKSSLDQFKLEIEEKIGAERLEISLTMPKKSYPHTAEFKVKLEKFTAWLEKV